MVATGNTVGDGEEFDPRDTDKMWAAYDASERGREVYSAATKAVYIDGIIPCPLPMPTDGMIDLPAVNVPRPIEFDLDLTEFEAGMRDVGAAFAAIGDILADRWAHVGAVIAEAFAPVYAITSGGPWSARIGEPIRTAADARAALAFAERVELWPGKRATKAWRTRARARYLECKRALPPAERRALARVRVNKFGAT